MEAALNQIKDLPVDQQIPKLLETLIARDKEIESLQTKVDSIENVDGGVTMDADGVAAFVGRFSKSFSQKACTPEMSVGMNFSKYKFSVECWQKLMSHIPKKEQATMLINGLPDQDYYGGLKKIVTQRLTWDKIQTNEGVDLILKELDNIIRCPSFVRLMQWQKKWNDLTQGNQSFEKHMLALRQLVRDAEEDFDFRIPPKMITAKMLLSCSAVTPENIGNITANIELQSGVTWI